MKTSTHNLRAVLAAACLAASPGVGWAQAQPTEGYVTRLPSAEQQSTTAELRRSVILKAQSLVDEARSNIANGAEPITRARGEYEADPSAANAINMIEACVQALRIAMPETVNLAQAANSASRACDSQLDDVKKGERELTVVLSHVGARLSDLQNLSANYDAVVERLRQRLGASADLTPTQDGLVRAALFNAKLSRRTSEHSEWTYGELLGSLKELQEAKADIAARALVFRRQARQAQAVGGHFQEARGNFEGVLGAWKKTADVRVFQTLTGKLEKDIDDTLEGLADVVAEGMPTLPPTPVREPTTGRGRSTLDRLFGGPAPSGDTLDLVDEGGAR